MDIISTKHHIKTEDLIKAMIIHIQIYEHLTLMTLSKKKQQLKFF